MSNGFKQSKQEAVDMARRIKAVPSWAIQEAVEYVGTVSKACGPAAILSDALPIAEALWERRKQGQREGMAAPDDAALMGLAGGTPEGAQDPGTAL